MIRERRKRKPRVTACDGDCLVVLRKRLGRDEELVVHHVEHDSLEFVHLLEGDAADFRVVFVRVKLVLVELARRDDARPQQAVHVGFRQREPVVRRYHAIDVRQRRDDISASGTRMRLDSTRERKNF